MHVRKWLVLVLIGVAILVLAGCEEAQTDAQNRELVVVNGTSDTQITRIDVTAFPFGQKATDPTGYFQFSEDNLLEAEEQFAMVISPYMYRVLITVRYIVDGDDSGSYSGRITIDLPIKPTQPTYITLVLNDDGGLPEYTFEVTGDYVDYDIPMLV